MTTKPITRQDLLEWGTAFMSGCILGAAAELELFDALGKQQLTGEEIAAKLGSDLRATRILLDALAALGVLEKVEDRYSVPASLQPSLSLHHPETILPMVLHRMNIFRAWAQMAWTVKAGIPAPRPASIRGWEADRDAFVAAMHVVSSPVADSLVAKLGPPPFHHLLDVGGASGTWTLAFLGARPNAVATIFDLPHAIEQAKRRLADHPQAKQIHLVAGDFYRDPLPAGADFAWVSAIAHQHAREDNRALFAKVFQALEPGGKIAIRDIVMAPDRTRPLQGALFAVNMLVATARGNTFTFEEFCEDLISAGFNSPELVVRSEDMNSVIMATKPSSSA